MVTLKSASALKRMRRAGRIVAEVLDMMGELIRPGVATEELDRKAEELICSRGGHPIFKGYRGYPKSICTSVNEEIVHGIPDGRKLREGDIIGIDVGVQFKRYIADAARTYAVGQISDEARRLMDVCKQSLMAGIAAAKSGNKLSDICRSIQTVVEKNGFSVVKEYTGHGVGKKLHEQPQIPNFVSWQVLEDDILLQPGMTLAIEPMINAGRSETKVLANGWTVVTEDGSLSAHFEHTIAVMKGAAEILTKL